MIQLMGFSNTSVVIVISTHFVDMASEAPLARNAKALTSVGYLDTVSTFTIA